MKKFIISSVFAFILIFQIVSAQSLYNYGGKIIVQNNANIVLTGNYTNMSHSADNGEIELNGNIYINGDFINNATSGGVFINSNSDGDVVFNKVGNSKISGTCGDAILFENITVESSTTLTNNHFSTLKGDLTLVGTNKVLTVGTGNLFVEGQIIGNNHSIVAISSGYFARSAVQNVTRTFPITDGSINFTVSITPLSGSTSGFIGVKLNKNKEVDGALKSPTTFWDLYGNENLNATVVLRLEKSVLDGTVIPENAIMRFWNGTRYAPIPSERTTITDFGTYYEITLTGINYFNVNF